MNQHLNNLVNKYKELSQNLKNEWKIEQIKECDNLNKLLHAEMIKNHPNTKKIMELRSELSTIIDLDIEILADTIELFSSTERKVKNGKLSNI